MRTRRRPAAVLGCALLFAVAGCGANEPSGGGRSSRPATTRPAAGKPAGHSDPGDFNGDGYDDFVDVVRSKSRDGKKHAANLVVVYGSRTGLVTATARRTPAGTEPDAAFTSAPLRADLDGDGFTDLIGSRGTGETARETFALFGGAHGLSSARRLDLPAGFRPLAAADFDGDGSLDLLDGGHGGSGDPGSTEKGSDGLLLYGPFDRKGTPARRTVLDLSQHGYATPATATTGDFDGDGRAEVVFTYFLDFEQEESEVEEGNGPPSDLHAIGVYEGGEQGLVRDTRQEKIIGGLTEPGVPETGDADGDGLPDLLVHTKFPTGALTILYGAKSGLDTGRERTVIGSTGAADWYSSGFGSSPAVGDVNGDGRPDVVVNTPTFRGHDGKVTLLPGRADGTQSLDGEQGIDSETDGLPGTRNPYDWNAFNHRPPLLDVDGDGHTDAVVFGPLYEKRKGAYLVLRGTDDGFAPKETRLFTPDDIGVPLRLK
ncbi:FG-GAP and VCBS repeat-containing protein [Streptomyces populi]